MREYLELCEQNDVPEEEARQLLGDLHRVGFLLYFDNGTGDESDPLSHIIFLRPEEIADKLYDELKLVSPTQRYVEEMAQQKQVGCVESNCGGHDGIIGERGREERRREEGRREERGREERRREERRGEEKSGEARRRVERRGEERTNKEKTPLKPPSTGLPPNARGRIRAPQGEGRCVRSPSQASHGLCEVGGCGSALGGSGLPVAAHVLRVVLGHHGARDVLYRELFCDRRLLLVAHVEVCSFLCLLGLVVSSG